MFPTNSDKQKLNVLHLKLNPTYFAKQSQSMAYAQSPLKRELGVL